MILRSLLRYLGHQRWIRYGIRYRIVSAFHNPDTSPSETFITSFFGKIYPGDFSTYIDWNTYYYGAYCGKELNLIRDAIDGVLNPVVLDIGANIGHHSLFASTVADKVYAFEPFPAVAAKIYEKIQVNAINNVIVHEVGLGETNEDLPYFPPFDNNTGNGSFTNLSGNDLTSMSLPIRRGDDYLERLQLPKIDFIKMDIEGFEPQALRGLQNLFTLIDLLFFFEWNAKERELNIDLKSLFPSGYQLFDFIPDRVIFGAFCKPGYYLTGYKPRRIDGNKLAIPEEKAENFFQTYNKHMNNVV